MAFAYFRDAKRALGVLDKRLARYGLYALEGPRSCQHVGLQQSSMGGKIVRTIGSYGRGSRSG